jgi:prepilin-type N-terminal cleavage/methylation domain-containing protein
MLNFFYRALNNKKGFTLIEVLVVVAIIGILAALAAPRIIGRIREANISHDIALARTLTDAVEQYIIDNGDKAPTVWSDIKDYLDTATYGYAEEDAALADLKIEGKFGDIIGTPVTLPNENDSIVFIADAAAEVEGGEEPIED